MRKVILALAVVFGLCVVAYTSDERASMRVGWEQSIREYWDRDHTSQILDLSKENHELRRELLDRRLEIADCKVRLEAIELREAARREIPDQLWLVAGYFWQLPAVERFQGWRVQWTSVEFGPIDFNRRDH